jgi:hypothetical protein
MIRNSRLLDAGGYPGPAPCRCWPPYASGPAPARRPRPRTRPRLRLRLPGALQPHVTSAAQHTSSRTRPRLRLPSASATGAASLVQTPGDLGLRIPTCCTTAGSKAHESEYSSSSPSASARRIAAACYIGGTAHEYSYSSPSPSAAAVISTPLGRRHQDVLRDSGNGACGDPAAFTASSIYCAASSIHCAASSICCSIASLTVTGPSSPLGRRHRDVLSDSGNGACGDPAAFICI